MDLNSSKGRALGVLTQWFLDFGHSLEIPVVVHYDDNLIKFYLLWSNCTRFVQIHPPDMKFLVKLLSLSPLLSYMKYFMESIIFFQSDGSRFVQPETLKLRTMSDYQISIEVTPGLMYCFYSEPLRYGP